VYLDICTASFNEIADAVLLLSGSGCLIEVVKLSLHWVHKIHFQKCMVLR
jgi:hypothetical protein